MPYLTFGPGPIKRVAINRQKIADGAPDPFHVHYKGRSYPAKSVAIDGLTELRYGDPNDQVGGARAWVETNDAITLEIEEQTLDNNSTA